MTEKDRNKILNYQQNVKKSIQEVDELKNGIYFDQYTHLKNEIN